VSRRSRRNPINLLALVPAEVQQVGARLRSAGTSTRTNLVGGAVVDLLSGRTPKDWDLEVFGLSFPKLLAVAEGMGKANAVGRSFGIVKLTLPSGLELDLSIPRYDNKVGIGHSGFETTLVPNMTNKEAARRRDFTINSMAVDLKTGKLIDPFNGLADLRAGVLRATDTVLFVQDPMRALRAMQLLARKAKTVHPDTLRLIKGMKHTASELTPERVLEEWRKLLLKAERPSVGLEFLQASGWIEAFPELVPLQDTPQHPDWHPEGDVWVHTKQIADAAAQVRHRVPKKQREAFVFGALLHDVGKATTTVRPEDVAAGRFPKERLYTAHGHDALGKAPARAFLERMKAPKKTTELAEALVGAHMQPYTMKAGNAGRSAYARLARKMRKAGGNLEILAIVSQCDACATGQGRHFHLGEPDWEHDTSQHLLDWAEQVDTPAAAKPLVQGRDLIKLGHKPGPHFKVILDFAQSLQDTGMGKAAIMEQVVAQYPVAKRNRRKRRARTNPWDESQRQTGSPCRRCGGSGHIDQFSHVQSGTCFKCGGSGVTTRDWRSDTPVFFDILGQRVRVYKVKGALHALVREVDFQEHGTPGVQNVGTFFLVSRGRVRGQNGSTVPVPWPVMVSAYPDYYQVVYEDRGGRALRARYLAAERKLSEKLTRALQQHYGT
jgi:tRNA nucleotidyltransferase (CCA-adding enzyme)